MPQAKMISAPCVVVDECQRQIAILETQIRLAQAQKDAAYVERNRVVAGLAALAVRLGWRAGLRQTDIKGWEREWHNAVYIDLPTGQVSWHYHDRDRDLFAFLPPYQDDWDGHDTPEKYRRLAALAKT
jgi:hypothetical protein